MSNTFDINRFGKVMKQQLVTRQHSVINTILGFGIAFSLVMIFSVSPLTFGEISEGIYKMKLGQSIGFIYPAVVVASQVFASYFIKDLYTKQARISDFMLPASLLEKFLSRVVMTVFVYMLAIFVGLVAGDIVQMIYSALVHHGQFYSVLSAISYSHFNVPTINDMSAFAIGMLSLLWVQSLYIIGGVLFRKTVWLKTTGILFIAGFLFTVLLSWVSFEFILTSDSFFSYLENMEVSDGTASMIASVVLLCLIAFNYFIAYKIFKRLQVINNRWINV